MTPMPNEKSQHILSYVCFMDGEIPQENEQNPRVRAYAGNILYYHYP